jgi:homoserine kinase
LKRDFGFDIEIYKNIKAGSGIGSSSCSRIMNALLGTPFETKDLVQFAMQGENCCGNAHADNVAPALLWIYFGEATAR